MKSDEIIKALRSCTGDTDGRIIVNAAADLIESLQTEICALNECKDKAVECLENHVRWSECWQLTDGSPSDNNMRYCPFCGREIETSEKGGLNNVCTDN